MAIQSNFPSLKPTLLLDFANTKQLDPRITFTRASTATYYDGKTTAMAEQNLLTYSQQFDNAAWTVGATIVAANTAVAPDGTSTADTVAETTAASTNHVVLASIATAANTVYCLSVFAKPASGTRFLTISIDGSGSAYASVTFDLSTGAVTQTLQVGYTSTAGTVTASSNGYYRCSFVTTTNSTAATFFRISLSDTGTFVSFSRGMAGYTGDGISGIYIWGAQLEQRSSVTAYTATTSAPITNYIPALQTAASGVARFDHAPAANPTTSVSAGESLGLLIEEQRTNLLGYSSDFDNAYWAKFNATVAANVIVAPDGTLSGDKIVEGATASSHSVQRTSGLTITSGASYTVSVYAKAAERTQIQLQYFDGTTNKYPVFSLIDGTKVADGGIGTSWTSLNVGNGWWRFTITVTSASTSAQVLIYPAFANSNSYTGDGYSGIYIWGAQLEAGAFVTSYIATTSAQVTRSADAASMTGTNFSSWNNNQQGTLYFDGTVLALNQAALPGMASIDDTTTTNRVLMFQSGTIVDSRVVFGGNAASTSNNTTVSANTTIKASLAYAVGTNQSMLTVNGVTGNANSPVGGFSPTRLVIGGGVSLGALNGQIKKIAYYPARVTNAQLQALTS